MSDRGDPVPPRRRSSRREIDPLLGATIAGDLVIERPIGGGSHADVFLARQRSVGDRKVALKVLCLPYLSLRESDFRRASVALLREAAVLGQMRSPVFVTVHSTGSLEDGRPFVVLEYVEGETLTQLMGRGAALGLEAVIQIVQEVAAGLEELHERGHVHRDVTPANLMVSVGPLGDLTVKVIDFGTVTRVSERADRFRVGYDLEHPLGTASYMAPEQARGDIVDGRADQFALAAVTLELLTGRRPVALASTTQRALLEYLRGDGVIPTRPVEPQDQLPAAAVAVLLRALSRDPEGRFATMRDFAVALRSASREAAPRPQGLLARIFGDRVDR